MDRSVRRHPLCREHLEANFADVSHEPIGERDRPRSLVKFGCHLRAVAGVADTAHRNASSSARCSLLTGPLARPAGPVAHPGMLVVRSDAGHWPRPRDTLHVGR